MIKLKHLIMCQSIHLSFMHEGSIMEKRHRWNTIWGRYYNLSRLWTSYLLPKTPIGLAVYMGLLLCSFRGVFVGESR